MTNDEQQTDPEPQEGAQEEPQFIYRSLDAFVTEYLCVVVRRPVGGGHLAWCPEWWQHPEAIARLAALWRAFEYLSQDPGLGMTSWWLHHADPHLAALMHPDKGPFAYCSGPDGHTDTLGELPYVPSPPELWDNPAFSLDATQP
ncbi:DUF4913 domain-containing protein [Streptomyces sp. NPDC094032]|uniref:DUF4913 domain-containing protein n=1 Tax=Streptomyces sp. NPDC094032 TaxID=3155308 RepID=UPI00332F12D3